uniref:ABC transporter permease n=1 Tax=Ascaris lumbricoides TaxID=6252 RepID=A0A0M3HX58_ASCLU
MSNIWQVFSNFTVTHHRRRVIWLFCLARNRLAVFFVRDIPRIGYLQMIVATGSMFGVYGRAYVTEGEYGY